MSEYDRFFGKPVDINIEGMTIQMRPLTIGEIDLLTNLQIDGKINSQVLIDILTKTITPIITKEDINQMSISILGTLIEKISEVNGLSKNHGKPNSATI